MEAKINIVEILKDKPKGTKLYADAFGELSIEEICTEDDNGITLSDNGGIDWLFYNDGKYSWRGESILVPSKEMRDWSKFAWKRGDVLVNKYNNSHIIFDKFNDDTYTTFTGKLFYQVVKAGYNYTHTCSDVMTQNFDIEKGDAVQTYINAIEERLGGKLNRETLEVEKTQPEFKDFDLITIKLPKGRSLIGIFKAENDENYYLHANLDSRDIFTIYEDSYCDKSTCTARLSTEEEKMHFFDVLAKNGKTWEAVKKQIVDLKPKWTPKPFDRVITRNADDDIWTANIFSHMDSHGEYVTIGCVGGYTYCIPFNEETAKLIGTTKDVEE